MEFKGTKGKWYIGEHRQTGIQIGCNESHYVAYAYRGGSDRADDVTIANAQLIAAAPEMLDALITLSEEAEEIYGKHSDRWGALNYAKETIAKALGKGADYE